MPATIGSYKPEDIRNIVLLGHGASGKTTLAEALLHRCGMITRMGSIAESNTQSDFEPEAREHKHSTSSVMLFATAQSREINMIDTPGFPDFIGQTLAALPAAETAIIVVNAQLGIETNTRRLFHAAGEMGLARMIVVNKIDLVDGSQLEELVAQLKDAFGAELHCINLPKDHARDVVDCFDLTSGSTDFGNVRDIHQEMVESVVEMNEKEMEKYLAGEPIDPAELKSSFVEAAVAGHVVPILFTAAKSGVGVDDLIHILVDEAPSPASARPKKLKKIDDGVVEIPCRADAPLLAHVFKVTTDPFIGKLAMLRILQGKMDSSTQFLCGHEKKSHKGGHLLKVEGRDHPEYASVAYAGDIVALAKIDDLHVDQIIHDPSIAETYHPILPKYPVPMYSLAVEPKSHGDEVKVATSMAKLAEEDPTFKYVHDPVTHELVVSGVGELHLRVVLEKMKNRFNLDVTTKPPRVAYRETITAKAEGHYRHRKQTGGAGQFAEVYLRVEPLNRGDGFEFVNDVFGGAIPTQFIPSVEKGVRDILENGAVAGYPVQDVRVIVYDGKHHPVDSKDIAFRTAGRMALREAITKARPALLEPVVNLEITAPEKHLGDITSDLNAKRGRVIGVDSQPGGMAVIRAAAPLAELTSYNSQLRSVTGGQASFIMEPSHYDVVPPQVQQKIMAAYKPKEEE